MEKMLHDNAIHDVIVTCTPGCFIDYYNPVNCKLI